MANLEGADKSSMIVRVSAVFAVLGIATAIMGGIMLITSIGEPDSVGWVFILIGLVLAIQITFVDPDE